VTENDWHLIAEAAQRGAEAMKTLIGAAAGARKGQQ
jgi:hypothetical protein